MSVFSDSLLFLIAQAAPASPAPSPAGSMLAQIVPFIFIFIAMYYVIIRPQQKRAKEQQSLITSARSGDEIVTSGGLHGIISNAREPESKTVLVKFAENVKIEVDKSAITSVTKASSKVTLPATKTI